jgi:hypothetical protein
MASSTETSVASNASSEDSGKTDEQLLDDGRPVHSEVPKSKRSTPQSQCPNCTSSGWSEPSCVHGGDLGRSIRPPVAAEDQERVTRRG